MGILDQQQKVTFNGRTSEVVVRSKGGNRLRAPFSATAPYSNKKRRKNMKKDVFDLLVQVSKGALEVFNNLKFNREENNNLTKYVPEEGMTRTQKETLSRKFKELKKVGLIKSVKGEFQDPGGIKIYTVPKGTFLINPEMIRCSNHDEAEYLWENCDG
jgi:hypothetical protein